MSLFHSLGEGVLPELPSFEDISTEASLPERQKPVDESVLQSFLKLQESEITKSTMVDFFSRRPILNSAGEFVGVGEPKLYVTDVFILKAGSLPSVKQDMLTTIGRYFFNMFCLASVFGDRIPYVNKNLKKSDIEGLSQLIVDKILDEIITTDEFALYQNKLVWLNNFTEMFIPGLTMRLITPLDSVMKLKSELIEKYKDDIEKGDYVKVVAMIEKVLLQKAEEELKDDPGWRLYENGGKPTFGNNYKSTQVITGPVKDPISGKYKICLSSLSEGIPRKDFAVYANTLVSGSYSRGVATQDGGAKTKFLFAAMQSEILDEPGSDCGTTMYAKFKITEKNKKNFLYRYIVTKSGLVLLNRDNIGNYIDQWLSFRSPLFCKSPKVCSKCAGELYYKIGIRNIGLTVTKITSTLLNLSLKQMHDVSIKPADFDPFNYMKTIK